MHDLLSDNKNLCKWFFSHFGLADGSFIDNMWFSFEDHFYKTGTSISKSTISGDHKKLRIYQEDIHEREGYSIGCIQCQSLIIPLLARKVQWLHYVSVLGRFWGDLAKFVAALHSEYKDNGTLHITGVSHRANKIALCKQVISCVTQPWVVKSEPWFVFPWLSSLETSHGQILGKDF